MNNICKFSLAALGASTMLAAPASAQEAFSGPYLVVSAGASFQSDSDDDSLIFDTDGDGVFDNQVNTTAPADAFGPGFCNGTAQGTGPGAGCTDDEAKLSYAARLGYDFRSPGSSLVFGALAEVSGEDGSDATSGFSTTPARYTLTREIDYALSLRARAGYVMGERALVYATGGASYARIHHSFDTSNGANSFTPVNDDKMQWGYQAGGGVEVMLTDVLSLGVEYLYHNYKDDDYYVAVGQGTADPLTNPFLLESGGTDIGSSNNFDFHTIRATVGFHF